MTHTSFAAQVRALEQEKAKALAEKISIGIARIKEKEILALLERREAKIAKAEQAVAKAQTQLNKAQVKLDKAQATLAKFLYR